MKRWLEPLFNTWEGVKTHKLRSSLTILGIVIGVSAVIALMSIGRGVQTQILSQIESMGSDVITISPEAVTARGVAGAGGSAANLTLEDAMAISEQVPYVASVAPYSSTLQQLIVGSENVNAQVIGVTPEYQEAYNLEITKGAFISPYDYQNGAKVVVIGANVKNTLFNDVDPIGQQLRMGNNIVRVMGVLESKGRSFGMGSTDDAIMIPLTTFQQTITQPRTASGEHVVSTIALIVSAEEQMDYVVTGTTSILRSRHGLGTGDEDDFRVQSMEELVSTITEVSGTMTLFLGFIAAISLVVGGIGVMNIMLVSS